MYDHNTYIIIIIYYYYYLYIVYILCICMDNSILNYQPLSHHGEWRYHLDMKC